MISSKPRLVVPYGLKTLLEGVSRAILKIHPVNITQFAALYFKELILFREGNTSLDIKDLVKQFHQIKVEKWSEGTTQEKKESMKEPGKTPVICNEPTRMEKSTDTEEDNIAGPQFINKTTQFPSVHADLPQNEETTEVLWGPSSKPATPKTTTPPSSPPPAPVPTEFAYVPADPAQFATQMLGNVPSTHSDVLMVDVATSMPASKEVLSTEIDEEIVVSAPLVCSGEMVEMQIVSQTTVQVDDAGPREHEAEPPMASLAPLQDEQEPPAYYDQAPEPPLQDDAQVTSVLHISSVFNGVPVTEGTVFVEQIPEHIVIPLTDQVASLKNEQSPPVSPKPVVPKTVSGISKISVESVKLVQLEENAQNQSSLHMEAEAVVLLSNTALVGHPEVPAEPLDAETFIRLASEKSLHLEVEIVTTDPDNPGQESGENAAPQPPGGPFPLEPEIQAEGEAAPEQV